MNKWKTEGSKIEPSKIDSLLYGNNSVYGFNEKEIVNCLKIGGYLQ